MFPCPLHVSLWLLFPHHKLIANPFFFAGSSAGAGSCDPIDLGSLSPNQTLQLLSSTLISSSVGDSCFSSLYEARWFRITLTQSVRVAVSTCSPNTTFDTFLHIAETRSFYDCDDSSYLYCRYTNNDDLGCAYDTRHRYITSIFHNSSLISSHSLIQFDAVANREYLIAVRGYYTYEAGDFELTITTDAPHPRAVVIHIWHPPANFVLLCSFLSWCWVV